MSKKEMKNEIPLKKIGVFTNDYIHSVPVSEMSYQRHMHVWRKDNILRDEKLLSELIKENAPIEVYIEYVDAAAKS